MKKAILISVFLWTALLNCSAQQSDTLLLAETSVIASRFQQYTIGQKTSTLDSARATGAGINYLSDLLADQSQVFVRNYGPANIATPSFRGTAAEHTAVLWNGINLQSPMLGLVDLSIIPANGFNEMEIRYGGNGAVYGSGAIGGAVLLNNRPRFNSGTHAQAGFTAGSFGMYRTALAVQNGTKQTYFNLAANQLTSDNNYNYLNTSAAGSPEQQLSHARMMQRSVQGEFHYALNTHSTLSFWAWSQLAAREIPPSLSVPVSESTQYDESFRGCAQWQHNAGQLHLTLKHAWLYAVLNYKDPLIALQTYSHAHTQVTDAELEWKSNGYFHYALTLLNTYNKATASGYTDQSNNRFAQLVSIRTARSLTWNAVGNIRFERMGSSWLPVMPSLGVEWKPLRSLKFNGNVTRSYRVPTLNELFWTPGGNPQLKPESGWGEEVGVAFKHNHARYSFSAGINVYNRNISDWIQWLPVSAMVWTPFNVQKVWNRGLENEISLTLPLSKEIYFIAGSGFCYMRSTIEQAGTTRGNQLPNAPRITQQYVARLYTRNSSLTFSHHYTGLRFGDAGNTTVLKEYQTSDLRFSHLLRMGKLQVRIDLASQNLFNTSYLIIADRPMPLRNFLAGITLQL